MENPLYIVSDNHFQNKTNQFEFKRRKRFFSLLNHIEDTGGTLIIAGDFFDFWYEYKGYIPFHYVEIFEKLKKLKKSGIEIYYILGNHDYWDFGLFNKIFSTKIFKNQYLVKKNNQKILIIHGDGIFKKDYNYLLFRKIIRSRLCIFLYGLLSPKVGYFIADKISKADKPSEYYKDNKSIKKKLTNYARERWQEVDVLLIGHYHQSGIINEKNKKLIFLGDWLNKFLVTIYNNGVWKQVKWDA